MQRSELSPSQCVAKSDISPSQSVAGNREGRYRPWTRRLPPGTRDRSVGIRIAISFVPNRSNRRSPSCCRLVSLLWVAGGVVQAMAVGAVLKKEVKQEGMRMVAVKSERGEPVVAVVAKKGTQSINNKKRPSGVRLAVRDGGEPRPSFHSGKHITRAEMRAVEEENQELRAYVAVLESQIDNQNAHIARLIAVVACSNT